MNDGISCLLQFVEVVETVIILDLAKVTESISI